MNTFLTLAGVLLVFLGLAYLYFPSSILFINKFARERLFSDARVLLERRKKGLLFLLCSVLLFYWSYYRAQYSPTRVMGYLVSMDRMVYQATHHFKEGQYNDAERICRKILNQDPAHSETLYMLAATRYMLGDAAGADKIWKKAEAVQPESSAAMRFRDICLQFRVRSSSS